MMQQRDGSGALPDSATGVGIAVSLQPRAALITPRFVCFRDYDVARSNRYFRMADCASQAGPALGRTVVFWGSGVLARFSSRPEPICEA